MKKYLLLMGTAFSNSYDIIFASTDLRDVVKYYHKNCEESVEHYYLIVELLDKDKFFLLYDEK